MSLNAAGTIAGCLTYRTTNRVNVAQVQTFRSQFATAAQVLNRASYREAAAAWRTIDTATRNKWHTKAAALSLPPFAAFAQEWKRQQITAPNLPLLPA